jgi:hypothetical protein
MGFAALNPSYELRAERFLSGGAAALPHKTAAPTVRRRGSYGPIADKQIVARDSGQFHFIEQPALVLERDAHREGHLEVIDAPNIRSTGHHTKFATITSCRPRLIMIQGCNEWGVSFAKLSAIPGHSNL